jgi:hypothetical protein
MCKSCIEKLVDTGFASELYFMICKHYLKDRVIISLYEPIFAETLRYLEINGFILTTELSNNIILAIPLIIDCEEREESKHCSGFCQRDFLDIKSE